MSNESEGTGKEKRSLPNLRYCADICLQALMTTAKNLCIAGLRNEIFTWDIPNTRSAVD
jgi:hypothetical protein